MSIDDLQLTGHFCPRSGFRERRRDVESRTLIDEALNRGGSDLDALTIVQWHNRQHKIADEKILATYSLSTFFDEDELYARRSINTAMIAFQTKIEEEFNGLSAVAQKGFAKHGGYDSPQSKYRAFRTIAYNLGYDDPFQTLFKPINDLTFLGHGIDGGIHDKFAEVLKAVERDLDSIKPGNARAIGRNFNYILGVQFRLIDNLVDNTKKKSRKSADAGPPKVSNHAFGLAIDCDPNFNPNVKFDFAKVVLEITGVDFSKSFSTSASPEVAVTKAYAAEKAASDTFKAWLAKWLPLYKEDKSQQKMISEAKAAGAAAPTFPKPADDAATRTKNFALIDRLLKVHEVTMSIVEGWSVNGIITIPLQLAVAFAKAGVNWGSQYGGYKDTMHFELFVSTALPPDSEPRSLIELKTAVPFDAIAEGRRLLAEKRARKHGKHAKHGG